MATIKDVAALAGVSLSTVSIVANGRAKQRNISQVTQERVLDAMREVGYRPSVAARKLRGGKERRQLTVFWADDFREIMLARFLKGLHAKSVRKLAGTTKKVRRCVKASTDFCFAILQK